MAPKRQQSGPALGQRQRRLGLLCRYIKQDVSVTACGVPPRLWLHCGTGLIAKLVYMRWLEPASKCRGGRDLPAQATQHQGSALLLVARVVAHTCGCGTVGLRLCLRTIAGRGNQAAALVPAAPQPRCLSRTVRHAQAPGAAAHTRPKGCHCPPMWRRALAGVGAGVVEDLLHAAHVLAAAEQLRGARAGVVHAGAHGACKMGR